MTSSRPSLEQLRRWILDELDGRWRSPTWFVDELGLSHTDWYRVALVLHRAAANGEAQVRGRGRHHRFRRPR